MGQSAAKLLRIVVKQAMENVQRLVERRRVQVNSKREATIW